MEESPFLKFPWDLRFYAILTRISILEESNSIPFSAQAWERGRNTVEFASPIMGGLPLKVPQSRNPDPLRDPGFHAD